MKKLWLRSAALAGCLLLSAPLALAQDASADALIAAARQAAQLVEEGRAADAWAAGSPVLRSRFPDKTFAETVQGGRKAFAATSLRTWAGVRRVRYDRDAELPAGVYGTVDFSTRLADGSMMFELVTLRQEADGQWRLVGYAPRRDQ